MATTITARATEALGIVSRRLAETPRWVQLAILLSVPISGYLTIRFRFRLSRWKKLGVGGLPHNAFGYFVNILMETFLSMETRSITPYDQPERDAPGWAQASEQERRMAMKSFLPEPLQRRRGTQAHSLRFAAPQRERFASEYQVPKIKEAYMAVWSDLVERNNETIEVRTSELERQGPAIFLKSSASAPKIADRSRKEIAHIHESDLSAHVTLSLADAKSVVANSWGERHQCSGRLLHLGYTMLYIPRTVDEVKVLKRLMQAGIDYMLSSEATEL